MRIELPSPFPTGTLARPQDDAPTLTLPAHWQATAEAWLDAPAVAACRVAPDEAAQALTLTL